MEEVFWRLAALQFEITRPVEAIKSLRFALFYLRLLLFDLLYLMN